MVYVLPFFAREGQPQKRLNSKLMCVACCFSQVLPRTLQEAAHLAVCFCMIRPFFTGICRTGVGLGPICAFL